MSEMREAFEEDYIKRFPRLTRESMEFDRYKKGGRYKDGYTQEAFTSFKRGSKWQIEQDAKICNEVCKLVNYNNGAKNENEDYKLGHVAASDECEIRIRNQNKGK